MNNLSKESVTWLTVDEAGEGQRIDNFLIKNLKGVPKSHIYRIMRSGEVRLGSKRVAATLRLKCGDVLRIPPIRVAENKEQGRTIPPSATRLMPRIVYEDDALIVLNKPAGLAVHGGSGISRGVIEQLRMEMPQAKFLELVHRLDRETSGLLLVAKKRSALTALHQAMRDGQMDKRYLTLVSGKWLNDRQVVKLPLLKFTTSTGERRVNVDAAGLNSHTIFNLKKRFGAYSLLEAELKTGRTHQIRVHLTHLGFPIAGDDKYGDFPLNKELQKRGLKRMFLHAYRLTINHPLSGEALHLEAPLPAELMEFLTLLEAEGSAETI